MGYVQVQALFDDIRQTGHPVTLVEPQALDPLERFDAAKAPFYKGMSQSCRLPELRH
jgi:hypothetical protein